MREIAANPPIEQTGNIIRIGARHENLHNISINYEIEAPMNSFLEASSVRATSPTTALEKIRNSPRGSGNIHATGLRGGFSIGTGSGDIYAEQTGDGDVKAQTGSGKRGIEKPSWRPARWHRLRATSKSAEHRPLPGIWKRARAMLNSGPQCRPHSGRLHRLGQRSHRPRNADSGFLGPSSRHRQNQRRRPNRPH